MKASAWKSLTQKHSVWRALGWFDVAQSYRRTLLGPWWYTFNIAIWSFAMTIVYGALFGYPTADYASFVLTGMIGWSWISALVTEGGSVFMSQAHHVRNPDIRNDWLVYAAAYKFFIIYLHQMVLVALFVALGLIHLTWNTLFVLPATLLLFFTSIPLIGVLGVLFVRYRDLQRLVSAAMLMVMMVTPVFWQAGSVKGWRTALVQFNPFYHWVEILRQPLLGHAPVMMDWLYLGGTAVLLYLVFFRFYRRFSPYVIFWI